MSVPPVSQKATERPLIAPRANETDDELRLREAFNRMAGTFMATLDSAIRLRSANGDAQRARHLTRGKLTEVGLLALNALNIASNPET